MSEDKKSEKDTFISLENQMIRGALHTHSTLSNYSNRINEIEAFTYGIADALIENGLISSKTIFKVVENLKNKMIANNEQLNPGVQLRIDNESSQNFVAVNCSERMHICKAVCCSLRFALSKEEIESGHVKWDLGHPYQIRHENGACTHKNTETGACTVYNNRPKVCSEYSCSKDERIWSDFDKMELNIEYISKNLDNPYFHQFAEE